MRNVTILTILLTLLTFGAHAGQVIKSGPGVATGGITDADDCPGVVCSLANDGQTCLQEDDNTFYACEGSAEAWVTVAAGAGEANTHSSQGGGLAVTAATPKSGVDLQLVSLDAGDFSLAADVVTVDDDGHDHTGTSISAVDISDDTNLAVTAPVVLTGDTLSLTQNAGTDVTADLEEEAHCAEHNSADITCSGETILIDDDGHDHTTSSISGVDISDDTNLAVTAPIVLTGDTLSITQNAGTDVTADLVEEGVTCTDCIDLAKLDDDAGSPTAGDFLGVRAGATDVAYITPNAGTDVTADLEEEAHCSEHNSADVDCSGETILVVDDAHDHTSTSISGVDISDDTNLAVSAPVSLTGDTVGITADTINRDDIDEQLTSIQTEATSCAGVTCDATSDGELCFEVDDDTLYACDGGETAWKVYFPGAHTADTNAGTECAGATTYLDGEGDCNDIDPVYENELDDSAGLHAALSDETGTGVAVFANTPIFVGTITADGLTMDNDELITIGANTFSSDAVTGWEFDSAVTLRNALPSWRFDDTVEAGDVDGKIEVDCPTTDDCDMIFFVDSGSDTEVVFMKIDTPDSGVSSLQIGDGVFTNFINITEAGVLTGEGSATIEADALTGTIPAGVEVNDLEADDPPNVETTEVYIGTASGAGAWAALSSDVLMTNAGVVTIQPDAVALTTDTTGSYAAGNAEAGDALTGDTATAFFDAGTIEHEFGGLEADVSGFSNGLFGTDGAATIDVDTEGELETAVGGINILIETEIDASSELLAIMDDETGTGLLVFGTSPTLITPVLGVAAATSITVTSQTECIILEASALGCATTGGCAATTNEGTNFDYKSADFDSATDEDGAWVFGPVPTNLTGTTASVQYTWTTGTCTGTTNDDVCFTVAAAAADDDEAWDSLALGTAVGSMDTCTTADDIYESAAFTITHGWVAGDTKAVVKVIRDVDAGIAGCADDNISNDVDLQSVSICYEVNNVFSGE